MLGRYARGVVRYRRTVLAATLAVTAVLGAQIPRLDVRFDPESAFPPADPSVRIDREIRREFGGRNFVVIAVVPTQGTVWQRGVLRAVQELTLAVRDLPGVMSQSLVSLASPAVRHVELTDEGIHEDYLMREVPETPAAIARLRAIVLADPLLVGGVVTEDERAALVLADFWPDTDHESIARAVHATVARFRDPAYDIHVTGEPIVSAAELAYARTAPLYLAAAVAVMMVVLLVAFRTWQGMVLPIVTGLLSAVWGVGLMAATGVPLGIWNQAVPTLVIIVAAGHSAQMLKRYLEEWERDGDNLRAVTEALVRIAPVMLAAGTTAALGFASMALVGLPGMADLGLSAAYGIGSAVVLELSFMPALRASLVPAPGRRAPGGGRHLLLDGLADRLLTRPGRAVILGLAALTLAWAGAGVPRIITSGSTTDYLPAGHRVTRDLEAIRGHFPGTVPMTILFHGPPGSATAPGTLAALDRLAAVLAAEPSVARTASLADLVKGLNAVFAPDGARELPDDPALLAQLLFLGRGPSFERFVDRADARTVLWVYLRGDRPEDVRPVLERARREAAALTLPAGGTFEVAGGQGPMMLALEERVTRGKLESIGALLAVIYVLASIVLASPVGGAFVVVPLVLSVAATFGIVAWAGVRFDVVSTSIIAIGVGIGADYAIYFLHRLREEYRRGQSLDATVRRALDTSGRAVLFVAVSIALGFTVFSVSAYRAFRLTGLLTPAGMLVSCAAALSVMPAVLLTVRPAFLFRRRRGAST